MPRKSQEPQAGAQITECFAQPTIHSSRLALHHRRMIQQNLQHVNLHFRRDAKTTRETLSGTESMKQLRP